MEHELKVLIVDDRTENLYALEKVLSVLDAEVTKAGSGNEALVASLNHEFALAVLDVQMPEMDGYELAELLRSQKKTRNLPIIFLSAVYNEDRYIFRGYEAGAVDFIVKPYQPEILLGKTKIFLELARQRLESRRMAEELRAANEALEQRVAERTKLAHARAAQLQTLAVELIEAEERERQRIARLLHDDLQQILAAARMQLQWACQRLPESKLENVVGLLEESFEKTRRLSHELSLAALHYTNLKDAIDGLIRRMSRQFGLQVALEADESLQLDGCRHRIFIVRAVQELLFNIVKHAGVKNAQVDLSASSRGIVVGVADQGRGFDPDILHSADPKIGLGLLSLRERASYIGGSLAIESARGKGSRFTLTVPFGERGADALQRTPAALETCSPVQGCECGPSDGIRMVFADDHKVMRQGLIRMLSEQPDIQVMGEAANGKEALELVRQLKPDVVVMDVSMPEMDGVEATRRIRAELPEVHVIGLTMYEDEQVARTMCQAGAEATVSKTASLAELLKVIYGIGRVGRHDGPVFSENPNPKETLRTRKRSTT